MENLYQAPQAALADEVVAKSRFYVVGQAKFLMLYVATFGLYGIYWFYRHWAEYRQHSGEKLWPVPRSIFAIFFAHSLFSKFDEAVDQGNWAERYQATPMATVFVLSQILQTVCDRLSANEIGMPFTLLASLAFLGLICWSLYRAQRVANHACGDPLGEGNASLGVANVIWMILGGLAWLMFAFGLWVILSGAPIEEPAPDLLDPAPDRY